jgi:DNA polymerase III gamma/tau subunit
MRLGRDNLLRIRTEIAEAHKTIRDISLPRLWLEAELIRIAQLCAQPAITATQPVAATPAPPKRAPATPAPAPTQPVPAQPAPPQSASPPPATAADSPSPAVGGAWEAVWERALAALPEGVPITRKARSMGPVTLEGNDLVIEVPRQMDVDWFHEKPGRLAHLIKVVKDAGGENWNLRLQASKKSSFAEEPDAVELPAEGQRLEQIAREVFGA